MILYKYYSDCVNSYKSIAIKGLWCHYPRNMNDPYECLGLSKRVLLNAEIKKIRTALQNVEKPVSIKMRNLNDSKLQDFINLQRNALINKLAFCSLSESFDNIKMWSHYASSHSGFVIGFEFEDFDNKVIFQKVKYENKLPKFDFTKLIDLIEKKSTEALKYLLEDLTIKTTDWKEEKEYRIWLTHSGYFHYKIENVKEIYFGVNASDDLKSIVLKLLEDLPKDFNFYNMKFSDNPIKLTWEK